MNYDWAYVILGGVDMETQVAKFKRVKLFQFGENEAFFEVRQLLNKMAIECVDQEEEAELILVLGGDGTMLHQAKIAHQYQIPILGINLGHLGFLAALEHSDQEGLIDILNGEYIEDSRPILNCMLNKQSYFAINEFMVCKDKATRMVSYDLYIDDEFVYQQRGDGIIVSTSTGSSAYARSAGGAIIHPKAAVMNIVPICSSKMTTGPMIISESSTVEIRVKPWKDGKAMFAVDAQDILEETQSIKIHMDKNRVRFLHPLHYNYYRTLQTKLSHGEL
ncbi:NAD(+)/NADH kinase [Candidatus Synchoanobacter obligatus]|uniref:NAD kinase n=1 Tax=Candidatus Synchoanobacter obligatus TaxID=2919597 RepID=A0ABT1L5D1_9GAMM|nr:NAD(+)/NADH kinase [Candidatus Synchoanobacter obligatus]MCP8352387.1 NAD(+)/NADH kinase [Candidatus Synchoanobacter obligatus]